jgi:hypothetical protein
MKQKLLFTFLCLAAGYIGQAQTITALINTTKDAIKISVDNIKFGIDTIRTGNDTVLIGSDTLKIGTILIVNKKQTQTFPEYKTTIRIGDSSKRWISGDFKKTKIEISKGPKKLKNIETNWWAFDLGFANYQDKSPMIYWLAEPVPYDLSIYPGPLSSKSFSLNNKKSSNVNIWVVQQKLNLYQHKINLKYGVGVEMFNFRFEKPISFREDISGFVKYDDVAFSKNKLLVKYLTIPVQINFKPYPNKRGFYASVGMSAGYLMNAKNKQISEERGKEKFEGNFNLNDWRLATIGELGIGSIRLYGSYGMTNLFNKSQVFYDMQPFALGLRFSKF